MTDTTAGPAETDVLHIRLAEAPVDHSPGQTVTALCGEEYVTGTFEESLAKTRGCAQCLRLLSDQASADAREYNDLVDRVEAVRALLDPSVAVDVHRHGGDVHVRIERPEEPTDG